LSQGAPDSSVAGKLGSGKSKIIVSAPMFQFFVPAHQYRESTSGSDATTEKREQLL